jgi:hypothetical protein
MWRQVAGSERERLLAEAVAFTGDAEKYGTAMMAVINAWPLSCEHNLTDLGQNRRAWLGHAACCLAIGCPEDVTREAWGHLSEEQRIAADRKALAAILAWQNAYKHGQLVLVVE